MTVFHWIGLAAVSFVGCALLVIWLQSRWQLVSDELASLRQELSNIRQEQALAMKGSYGMGQRMLRMERRIKALDASITDASTNQASIPDETPFSYSQAAQMVEQGADVEAIAATCGLSHSEAHLIRKLSKAANTPEEVDI